MPNANVNSTQMGLQRITVMNPQGIIQSRSEQAQLGTNHIIKRESVNTPNFRSSRQKWSLPMNVYTAERQIHSYTRGVYQYQYGNFYALGDITQRVGCIQNLVPIPTTYTSLVPDEKASIDRRAIAKLTSRLKNQKINLAQVYAERKQTANLIASTAEKIAASLYYVKVGKYKLAAESLGVTLSNRREKALKRKLAGIGKKNTKAQANAWLELQYGWEPLLNDVFGAAEALAASTEKVIRGKVTASVTGKLHDMRNDTIGAYFRNFNVTEVEYTRKYVVYFSASNEFSMTLGQFGITNPAVIAWELLPWSFVVDWFLPIGNWLSSFDATLGLTFEKGCVTTFEKASRSHNISGTSKQGFETYSCTAKGHSNWVYVSRSRLISFPSASFPDFKNPLSYDHALNAIALLRQSFKK